MQPIRADCIMISIAMLDNTQLEEQRRLLERAQKDPLAFGEIFDAHYNVILNYAVRRTDSVAAAEDITAITFFKALDGIGSFRWQGVPISAWLYRIAGNEIRMYYRKQKKLVSLDQLSEDGFEPVDERNLQEELQEAEASIERDLDFKRMRASVMTLPSKYQEVLTLRFGERKKLSEIAAILNKKEGTVKSLLSRALARLRADMRPKVQPSSPVDIMDSEGPYKPQEEYERQ